MPLKKVSSSPFLKLMLEWFPQKEGIVDIRINTKRDLSEVCDVFINGKIQRDKHVVSVLHWARTYLEPKGRWILLSETKEIGLTSHMINLVAYCNIKGLAPERKYYERARNGGKKSDL